MSDNALPTMPAIGARAYVEGYADAAKMALDALSRLPLMKAKAAIKEMLKASLQRAAELKAESSS